MKQLILIASVSLVALSGLSCKKKNEEQSVAQGRKDAFSADDIESVEILFEVKSIEPWTLNKPYLVGMFANKSKGNIISDVVWGSSKSDVVSVDNKTGMFLAIDNVEFDLNAKFRDFEVSKNLKVSYVEDSKVKILEEAEDVEVAQVGADNKIDLSWKLPSYFVDGVEISYLKGDAEPAKACVGGAGEVAVPFEDLIDKKYFQLTDLDLGNTYQIRICSVQRETIGEKVFSRSSDGVVATLSLSASP